MATQTLPENPAAPKQPKSLRPPRPLTAGGALYGLLRLVSSLQLTVFLMVLAIGLVFIGTLAQARESMWEVMDNYFHSLVAVVSIDVFFPPAWFPKYEHSPIWFVYPGGFLIGTAMAVNLVSAHLVRFQMQAKGTRLWQGASVMLLGAAVTALVIVSGHNDAGLQGQPAFSWDQMWIGIQIFLAMSFVGLGITAVRTDPARKLERWTAAILAAVCGSLATLTVLGGAAVRMPDAGLRILWQLMQGGIGGAILLAGCLILFKKRGGIVLIHLGVGLLMFSELFVSLYNNEEHMRIWEHQSTSFGESARELELAIVDPSDPETDRVLSIPARLLAQKGAKIDDVRLPFRIEVVDFYKNSTTEPAKSGKPNPATLGLGTVEIAEAAESMGGASSRENLASAYLRLTGQENNADLGVILVSQHFMNNLGNPIPDQIRVGDKTYEVALRRKRTYRDYTVELTKTERKNYFGTETPRDYSSDVVIHDHRRQTEQRAHIWMNNPLRYAGETFYQAGHFQDPQTGAQVSTLQVVTNRGWMMPYVGCMLVALGMLAHFSGTLIRFQASFDVYRPSLWVGSAIVVATVLAAVGTCIPLVSGSVDKDGWHFTEFGAMPAMYDGRVMPLEAVARNQLRSLLQRETFYDTDGHAQPAIRWLADMLAGREDADKYLVFRIDWPELRDALGLKERNEGKERLRYSFKEIEAVQSTLLQLAEDAGKHRKRDEKGLSLLEKKVLLFSEKYQWVQGLRTVNRLPRANRDDAFDDLAYLVAGVSNFERIERANFPKFALSDAPDAPFQAHMRAAARQLVAELSEKYNTSDAHSIAARLTEASQASPELRKMLRILEQEIVADLVARVRPDEGDLSDEERAGRVKRLMETMPENAREQLRAMAMQEARERLSGMTQAGEKAIRLIQADQPGSKQPAALIAALTALREGDREAFNSSVADATEALRSDRPDGVNLAATGFESWFVRAQWFYNLSIWYVVAFLLAASSWLMFRTWLRAAAFWMLLWLVIAHGFAIGGRIYISGRPPVTNLEGSAIFIAFAAALLALILEWRSRLAIGSAVAAVSGFAGLLIYYCLGLEGKDDLGVMQAVLDTQFWLATHVIFITLGYATTFLAGLFGNVFIIGGAGTRALESQDRRTMYQMTYGVLCFATLFSLVGTILGGLWADDSWGRFWGWDPKENGALIIVLWNAVVLHARWGGMVRERGLAVLAVIGNIVTAWSWFGVNQLGIGLHSYGFTEGTLRALGLFILSQIIVAGIGLLPRDWWLSYRQSADGDILQAELA